MDQARESSPVDVSTALADFGLGSVDALEGSALGNILTEVYASRDGAGAAGGVMHSSHSSFSQHSSTSW
ncbi:hypothetical protein AB0M95_20100 [Sphaerisporangium sp. NPDC051017]|uniref:hypothetical protein n=1 Tax=Sphaerisporangium sp. NPDC051017 TaxID=3154636 RepID=UPI00343469A3